jgi:hypothetical protein
MNRRFDLHVLGWLTVLIGALLVAPAVVALALGERWWPFVASAACAFAVGGLIVLLTRAEDRRMNGRDGFLVVGGAWLLASLHGSLPYLIAGVLGPVDAVFETVSGFTTTGSTVVADVGAIPRALLFWRALTQWVGGMGIILFTIAILPLLGIGGMRDRTFDFHRWRIPAGRRGWEAPGARAMSLRSATRSRQRWTQSGAGVAKGYEACDEAIGSEVWRHLRRARPPGEESQYF